MRMWILSVGESKVDKGILLTPGVDRGLMVSTPVPAYLIETDAGERVLIDTGMHPGHIDDPDMTWRGVEAMDGVMQIKMSDEHRIERQLALLGMQTDDVTHVISSHLHFDHCGQHDRFTEQPILVSGAHLAAARADPTFFPSRYFDGLGLNFVDTDGDTELLPGITVVETPGHAPHHRSFLIDLPRTGPLLLAIDSILSHHQIDSDSWVGQPDPEAARDSGHLVQQIAAEKGAEILFGHDPDQWLGVRRVPRFYD